MIAASDDMLGVYRQFHSKLVVVPYETSAENMCFWLFDRILGTGLALNTVQLRETTSSCITYSYGDYLDDRDRFNV